MTTKAENVVVCPTCKRPWPDAKSPDPRGVVVLCEFCKEPKKALFLIRGKYVCYEHRNKP